MKSSYLVHVIVLFLVITPGLVSLSVTQAQTLETGEDAENFPSYLTPTGYDALTEITSSSNALSSEDPAYTPINPNVIKVTQNIYGALPPWTYKAYDIRGTIAICVDIDYLPPDWYIWVGIWDEETNIWYRITGTGGSVLWCPSTEGYEELRIANPHAPYTEVTIVYLGTLTKYYW